MFHVDPALDAIAEHRAAFAAYLSVVEAAQEPRHELVRAEAEALAALAVTKPTTIEGAAELVRYVGRVRSAREVWTPEWEDVHVESLASALIAMAESHRAMPTRHRPMKG